MRVRAPVSSSSPPAVEGWRVSFAAVFASQFVAVLGFSMFVPFLPLYLGELGVPTAAEQALWSGVIFGITPLLAGLASPFWGSLGDKFGPKLMLVRAQLLGGLAVALMAFAPNALWLLAFRIVQGVVGGNMGPAVALAAAVSPPARLGTTLGLMQMAVYGGASVGPLLGGILAEAVGYRLAFLVTALCQLTAGLLVLLVVRHSGRVATRRQEQTVLGDVRILLTTPALLSVVAVAFGVYFANGGLQSVLSLFVESLHEGGSVAFTVGVIFGLAAAASTVSAVVSGRLSDTIGQRTVLVVALAGAALASAPLAFASSSWQLGVGRVVMGLFVGGALPLINVLAARIGGPERRAGAIGVAQMAGSLGLASGPLAGSAVAALFWLGAPFLLIAAVLGAGAVWAFVALRHTREDGR
ncbi:MAG: MFS transporter [Chloroflexota bacterium]|nr:MFS transporter [Dehalococcoidia bacterium]MDW8253405.1 MFS transporter [Chloroflexota bacterium]